MQNRVKDSNGTTIYQKDLNGDIVSNFNKKGVPLSDVWDIPYLNPKARERNGYPTQKPILLLEQIVKLASDENDIVLDPFCGSGTTLAAAKLLNRKYIGIDISDDAINLCKDRLSGKIIKTHSKLLENGIDQYNQKSEAENALIKIIGALPVQRNSGIDAIITFDINNDAIALKFQKETESLDEAMEKMDKACEKKGISKKIIIKNDQSIEHTLLKNETTCKISNIKVFNSLKDLFIYVCMYVNQFVAILTNVILQTYDGKHQNVGK